MARRKIQDSLDSFVRAAHKQGMSYAEAQQKETSRLTGGWTGVPEGYRFAGRRQHGKKSQ